MNRKLPAVFVLIAVVLALAGGYYFYQKQQQDAAAKELIQKVRIAIGDLENLKLSQADSSLQSIAGQVPSEPIVIRNLAICRYLQLVDDKLSYQEIMPTLERLKDVSPDQPSTYWLIAKSIHKSNPSNVDSVLENFRKASQLAPEDPLYFYEIYGICNDLAISEEPTSARAKEAVDALGEAYRLSPRNIFLLLDWLLLQADGQDPAIVKTIEQAQETLAPLRDPIRRRNNLDLMEFLTKAKEAVVAAQWPVASRQLRLVGNIVRPHDFAQSDRRSLSPHPLEFVETSWSEQFKGQYDVFGLTSSVPETVNLALSPDLSSPSKIENVRDCVIIDFDLDDRPDLLVLTDRQLQGWARDGKDAEFQLKIKYELPEKFSGGLSRILAADLDQDRDARTGKEIGSPILLQLPTDEPNNTEPNTAFSQSVVQDEKGSSLPGQASRYCFDADPDVVLYGEAGVLVLRNDVDAATGARSFSVIEQEDSVQTIKNINQAILVDFDHDSNLDIVAATENGVSLLLAQGGMLYSDVSQYSPEVSQLRSVSSLVAVDWDRDVDIDIVFSTNSTEPAGYFENLRHGDFRLRQFSDEYAELSESSLIEIVDADCNVSWDLVGAGESGLILSSTRTPKSGTVQFQSAVTLSKDSFEHIAIGDLNNDGFMDQVGVSGTALKVFLGNGQGSFVQQSDMTIDLPSEIKSLSIVDLDQDGDLDIVIANAEGWTTIDNQSGNENYWLSVRALGQSDNQGKANHNAIGSLVELKAGPIYQPQTVRGPVTHFGLGQQSKADVVRFLWTNGVPQAAVAPDANQVLCEPMVLKGSCPFIYTWTGERYEFFTDCLWAAPIGLQVAENVLAPSRAWEYLKIPGDRLRPKAGRYSLQLTEELWEAAYFDKVELFAVDHPKEIDIYTNEKVGPDNIAIEKIFTVTNKRYPVSAIDQRGRDVIEKIRYRDGDFLKAFDRVLMPGLAEEHYLELDLGPFETPSEITLFMTGWIYPTDTSSNVALSRHPDRSGPRPPRLMVPDSEGQWREVQAFMGFPGGKTKTIAIDLSQAFLCDDHKLRIVTSNEIFWDDAFFTVDDPAGEFRKTKLEIESADLHYRGFSRAKAVKPNSPQEYDYSFCDRSPRWSPMQGRFTRYGDCLPLVLDADDQMVVMNSGDELTVEFRVPDAPVPEGWVRDFILHNVGWDKDADLNTVYGQTSEPLPYLSMQSYVPSENDTAPESQQYREYLRRYQTRVTEPGLFWRGVKGSE